MIAALLTPRDERGAIDEAAIRRNVALVMEAGAAGVCVNGATGEYVSCNTEERTRLVRIARSAMNGSGLLISGAGAANWRECVGLAGRALESRADGVLVPPPHFFRYSDSDLAEFYRQVSEHVDGSILLYNLPQFTSGISLQMARRLIGELPNVIGIKDSSGKLDTLDSLRSEDGGSVRRILGNDGAMRAAFLRASCNGVISGIAGVLPELTVSLYRCYCAGATDNLEAGLKLQDEFIAELEAFPVPWGLKVTAAARGLFTASFALPLTAGREEQVTAFEEWFPGWWARCADWRAGLQR